VLGRAGVAPELFERTKGPRDVVCGGFLSWDALAALDQLGIDVWALGARSIERVRLVSSQQTVEASLPYRAAGLSRRTLDEALIAAAAHAGTTVRRGVAVKAADGPRTIRLDTGDCIESDALLLATGKHELRGLTRSGIQPGLEQVVGFRTALEPSRVSRDELEGIVELHLFDRGYAGILLQEDGSANLCLSVAADRLKDAGGIEDFMGALSTELPSLKRRLQGGGGHTEWTSIAGIPYGWRAKRTSSGVFRLGDQGAVIASLVGDGVAIALTSGIKAATALIRDGHSAAEEFQNRFSDRASRPLAIASGLRWTAEHHTSRGWLMRMISVAPSLAPLAALLTRVAD
jgi:flavin-dependent dehydrogenase